MTFAANADPDTVQVYAQAHASLQPMDPECGDSTARKLSASNETREPSRPAPKEKRPTKASKVEALLARKSGATHEQMCEATGWQAHTCRAFMTGLRKKGREIVRKTGKGGKSIYRLAAANAGARAG